MKQKIIIIGAGESGKTIYNELIKNKKYSIIGFIDDDVEKQNQNIHGHMILGTSRYLYELINSRDRPDILILAIKNAKRPELFTALLSAKENGIFTCDMPYMYEELTGKIRIDYIRESWLIYTPFHAIKNNLYTNFLKRFFDIVLSFTGIIIASPIIIIIPLVIKLDSTGPVIYRQKRIRKSGREFNIFKFRSMIHNAEKNGALWAQNEDPRITDVGRFIRKTRIDEIPQLWNVLRGEMSLIGPRPERPEFVQLLTKKIPFYGLRHAVKPGLTGWAQVKFRYGASQDDSFEKLQYDLYYIKNFSVWLDFRIFFKTIKVVFWGSGAR